MDSGLVSMFLDFPWRLDTHLDVFLINDSKTQGLLSRFNIYMCALRTKTNQTVVFNCQGRFFFRLNIILNVLNIFDDLSRIQFLFIFQLSVL